MSFNFSDIEEEEEFDLQDFDETGLLAQAPNENRDVAVAAASSSAAVFGNDADEEDSDGGDWDNIDWEDADEDEEEEDSDNDDHCEESLPSFPQEGITINIGRRVGTSNNPDDIDVQREEQKEEVAAQDKPPKKKRKAVRVLRNVSPETQQLLLNIRRTHLLCCMIHSMQCSLLCSGGDDISAHDESTELFHTALSLIPEQFHTHQSTNVSHSTYIIPTSSKVKQFADWFFDFVNHAGKRRRRAMGRNAAQGATAPSTRSKRKRSKEVDNSRIDQTQQTPFTSTLLRRLRHLSPCYDDEPQLFLEQEGEDPINAVESITVQEKVMLFLVMVRSMGWRARHVSALSAIPLKLTVDHPLFKISSPPTASLDMKPSASNMSGTTDVLQNMIRLMIEEKAVTINGKKCGRKKRRTQQKESASEDKEDAIDLVSSGEEEEKRSSKNGQMDKGLSWIEVLRCSDDKVGRKISPAKPAAQWMSIFLEQESIDQPKLVENILAWMDNEANNVNKSSGRAKSKGKKGKLQLDRRSAHQTKKKSPVSYVVAVEHLSANMSCASNAQGVRFTDVTRRYASMWSRTLSLRGATNKDIKERRGQCVDEWFKSSLTRLNNHFRPATKSKELKMKRESKSPVRSVTKVKGSDGRFVDVLELESSDDEDKKPAAKRLVNEDDVDKDDHVINEKEELDDNAAQEVIPKSKAAFKSHPFYVIASVLNSKEVLHPDARKRVCGVFKGELVYRRSDVSKPLKANKWLYEGRKVKDSELQKPVKNVKARKKPKKRGFQALDSYGITESAQDEAIALLDEKKDNAEDDSMDNLYGIWQTDRWSPPYVGPSDPIPTNEYKNVEKELLNPGLTHLEQPRLAGIARKLGIPYAPCMLGFERHGGRGTPSIRGIVVHDHNVGLIREAAIEWESHVVEKERNERRKEILKRWKRLVVGLLTKERLEREYGSQG